MTSDAEELRRRSEIMFGGLKIVGAWRCDTTNVEGFPLGHRSRSNRHLLFMHHITRMTIEARAVHQAAFCGLWRWKEAEAEAEG